MEKWLVLLLLTAGLLSPVFAQTGPVKKAESYTYHLTAGFHLDSEDLEAVCSTEFGTGASLADWAELKTWIASLPDGMAGFYAETGMPVGGICYLKRDGVRYWSTGRHYFIQQFNDGAPGGFAVHDSYMSLYLGSWGGMNIQVLAKVPAGEVPVRLSSFTGVRAGDKIHLTWRTESETGNLGFFILRSENGSQPREVGFIQGAGTTTEPGEYTFTDPAKGPGRLIYQLIQADQNGRRTLAGTVQIDLELPEIPVLEAGYPNPFNPEITLPVRLPGPYRVTLTAWNLLGMNCGQVFSGDLPAGTHRLTWNPGLASGLYLIRMDAVNRETGKVITAGPVRAILIR